MSYLGLGCLGAIVATIILEINKKLKYDSLIKGLIAFGFIGLVLIFTLVCPLTLWLTGINGYFGKKHSILGIAHRQRLCRYNNFMLIECPKGVKFARHWIHFIRAFRDRVAP